MCAPERQSPMVGLGHERDEQAVLLGDLLQQHPQEHQPVGHPQRRRCSRSRARTANSALRHDVLQPPAQLLEDVDERAEIPHGIDGVLDVVAERLAPRPHALARQRVVVERLHRLAVAPAHDDELRLDAREPRKSLCRRIADRAPERLARTQVVRRILPPQIREHPRAGPIPGTDDQGVQIGHRDLVGVGRRQVRARTRPSAPRTADPCPCTGSRNCSSGTGLVFGTPSMSTQHEST